MDAIENDSNVYILGAGFSRPRGLPLVSDFMLTLRDAHKWLSSEGRDQEAEAIRKVLQFRKESTSAAYRIRIDLENIEELFSLASATNEELSSQIRLAIAATLDFCVQTKQNPKTAFEFRPEDDFFPPDSWKEFIGNNGSGDTVPFDVPTYEFLSASLIGRLDAASNGKNCFVTLNYDLVLEEALQSIGVGFNYCFGPKAVNYDDSFRALINDEMPLLKLHGSMNWAFTGGRGGKLRIYGAYRDVRNAGLTPELVPPTWRKSFTKQSSTVWERAREELTRATRIIVLGFSIPPTDFHFKYLLAAGLRENISLREIVFVNPDKETILARAQELFGDLSMRPSVRVVANHIQGFSRNGSTTDNVGSIGRNIHQSIQRIQHPF